MPILPLYVPPATTPNAWHQVTAPGGYECWHFDAEDVASNVRIVVDFTEGGGAHSAYRRRYARYRLLPTCFAPPAPGDYPCVRFAVYRGERPAWEFTKHYSASDFHASDIALDVRIGPNTLRRESDGKYHLHIEGDTVQANLVFQPRFAHPPTERTFLSRQLSGAEHRWIITDPLCDVQGSIAASADRLDFSGVGYHDHQFGTGPLGSGLSWFIHGRVLLNDLTLTFCLGKSPNRKLPDESHLVEADAAGIRDRVAPATIVGGMFRSGWGAAYPRGLRFGDVMELERPRVIESKGSSARLIYDAKVEGGNGSALCHLAVTGWHR